MSLRVSRRSLLVYICICNAIRESELRRAARHVSGDAEACYAAMGKAIERDYFLQNVRSNKSKLPKKTTSMFPHLMKQV